jgi:carbonic anhydrase
MHSPSEHTIDGKNYDLEFHIVHKHFTENKLAVLGIFFDSTAGGNKESDFIKSLNISLIGNSPSLVVPKIPLMDLLKTVR